MVERTSNQTMAPISQTNQNLGMAYVLNINMALCAACAKELFSAIALVFRDNDKRSFSFSDKAALANVCVMSISLGLQVVAGFMMIILRNDTESGSLQDHAIEMGVNQDPRERERHGILLQREILLRLNRRQRNQRVRTFIQLISFAINFINCLSFAMAQLYKKEE
jgi:hypothetical protein